MTNACYTLRVNCIDGIVPNRERLAAQVETQRRRHHRLDAVHRLRGRRDAGPDGADHDVHRRPVVSSGHYRGGRERGALTETAPGVVLLTGLSSCCWRSHVCDDDLSSSSSSSSP